VASGADAVALGPAVQDGLGIVAHAQGNVMTIAGRQLGALIKGTSCRNQMLVNLICQKATTLFLIASTLNSQKQIMFFLIEIHP